MKKQYSVLFADADNTLFDFTASETHAFTATMTEFGVRVTPQMRMRYSAISDGLWKAFEHGQTTQAALRVERFRLLCEEYNLPLPAAEVARRYTDCLGLCTYLLPDALSCVRRWSQWVPIYLVTNGLTDVQRSRLERSELKPFIRDIIISQEVGAQKPDPRAFAAALERAGRPDPADVLVLGDSLSSDIKGAVNAGLDSCYFNPQGVPNLFGITPTYEIRSLHEVDALLCQGAYASHASSVRSDEAAKR